MTEEVFRLKVVTPLGTVEKDVVSMRLRDDSGSFGILKNHTDFLTVLDPSLCSCRDGNGEETYIAVDGGLLIVHQGEVTIISREVLESRDPRGLSETIDRLASKRVREEALFREMLGELERSFLEKSLALTRETP